MKKNVFYGGTFDPLHVGHQQAIQVLARHFDEVAVVICDNYLKKMPILDYEFRFQCLNQIVSNLSNVKILDLKDKCDISSTYSVVQYLEKLYQSKPTISFGSDCLLSIEKWKNFDKLKDYEYFVFRRNEDWKETGLNVTISPQMIDQISSTDIKNNRLYHKIPEEIREVIVSKMI